MLTRLFLLNPPSGVSPEEFDRWYIGVHAQEAKVIESICKYVSWTGEKIPANLLDQRFARLNRWHRLTEIGMRNTSGRGGGPGPAWTPPPYPQRVPTFPEWWEEETIVIPDKSEYDLLREIPSVD